MSRAAKAGLASPKSLEALEQRIVLDSTVAFNEIHYNPPGVGAASDSLEWIELHNQQAVDMDLSGWRLDDGVNYKFPEGTILKGGKDLIIAADPAAFQAATGITGAKGPFTGHLSNSGETVELKEKGGRVIDSVSYDTKGNWPVAPDGSGVTLAKINPDTSSGPGANWASSVKVGGTPGAVNFPAGVPAPLLTFNELSSGAFGFIEITNPTNATQTLDGYVIKRLGATVDQYVFPAGTSLAAHGYLALTPAQLGFTLATVDKLFLVSPDGTNVVDGASAPDFIKGRSPDGTGDWLVPSAPTPGAANTFQFHNDVVINEIMYHHTPVTGQPAVVQQGTAIDYTNNQWKYEQSGTDLGTGWAAENFDDSGWATGQGVFYGGNVPGVIGASPAPVAVSGIFGTGLNAAGTPGTSGSVDPHWVVTPPGGTSPVPAIIMTPHPAWAANNAQSGWISPVQQGTTNQAVGDFRYKTTFNLDGYVPSSATVTMTLYADNSVTDVLINGKSTGINMVGFAAPAGPFTITAGFVGGVNTLEFVVNNADGPGPNPHAFRAVLSATARPIPKNTELNLGPKTYYFRNTFQYNGDLAKTTLTLNALIDDGAVVYLNGTPIQRINMPLTGVDYNTPALTAVGTPGFGSPITLPAGPLKVGTNVLAVEVHQAAGDVSDVAMGLQLLTTQTTPAVPFGDSPEQWIELYNKSNATVDLTGWKLHNAVEYAFPAGTTMAPGEYLVVAKDPVALAAKFPSARIVGGFSEKLSHSEDLIQLLDPSGNPADEVHYYDSKPWASAADGGGSTLELRDPSADNSKPEAWAASNEGTKSSWKTYTYSGVAANLLGDPIKWNEFVIGLLDSGEVLLDDISVLDLTTGSPTSLIQNGTFQSGLGTWRIIGNHGTSAVITDPTDPANKVLDLVATGPTESMHNHGETTLLGNTPIVNGHTYQISFRAKWISGSNLLNTRLYFNRVSRTTAIDVPQANGTPGAPNSTLQANVGPTFSGLSQNVVFPGAGTAVTVSVRAEDPQGVATINLLYSVNGGAFNTLPMTLGSNGLYSATIPGQNAAATVQFYVQATDTLGAVANYPAAGANSRALYKVNDGVPQAALAHTIRIVMTTADIVKLHTLTNVMSDALMGATVIYDNREIFYDVGVSLKSSERGRADDARVGFGVDFNADHLFRGTTQSITIDRSSASGGAQSEILAKQAINHAAGGVPTNYNDIVKVIAPRSQNTSSALLQMDPYGSDYLDSAFKDGADGDVFKLELIYYPTSTVDGNVQSLKIPQPDDVVGVDIQDLGNDKEQYRYHWLRGNHRDEDSFDDVMNLGKLFSMSGAALETGAKQLLDVNEWLRVFALESLFMVTDVYNQGLPHNLKVYTRPKDGKTMALQWDWDYGFINATNSSIYGSANFNKIVQLPTNKHLYLGNLQNILTTTFNTSYMSYWTTHYGQVAGQNYSNDLSLITSRAAWVQSQLPPQIAFSITSANNQTVNTPTVTLTGKGWVNVKEIRLQGNTEPLDVSWSGTNVDTWTAAVPVYTGANHLVLEAYDFEGNLIATQSLDVTSTANTQNLPANLRVTEINYNPPPEPPGTPYDSEDFEFVEFKNFGSQPLNLNGAHFTNGLTFTFGDVTLLPGQAGVLVANLAAFRSRYGTAPLVLGSYETSGTSLNNGGERITLVDSVNQTVVDFTYDNDVETGWYPSTDGGGYSLELINPGANTGLSDPTSWRPSPQSLGNPGADDSVPAAAPANPVAVAGGDKITISWTPSLGAATYRVYRATTPGGQGAVPLASNLAGTTYVDTTAVGGNTYYYVVSAVNPGGEGARSPEASAHSHVPGDANDDNSVDFNDLVKLAQNYNSTAGNLAWADGDFTGDGKVDFNDLVILAQNYNTTRVPGAPVAASPANPVGRAPFNQLLAAVAGTTAVTPPTTSSKPKPTPVTPKPVVKAAPPKPVAKPVRGTTPAAVVAAPALPVFSKQKIAQRRPATAALLA